VVFRAGPRGACVSPVDRIREVEGLEPDLCFSCRRCSAGCPVADDMELAPHQHVRLVAAAIAEEALPSSGTWLRISCQTCTARCPNGVDVAGVMDALKQGAAASGVKPGDGLAREDLRPSLKSRPLVSVSCVFDTPDVNLPRFHFNKWYPILDSGRPVSACRGQETAEITLYDGRHVESLLHGIVAYACHAL